MDTVQINFINNEQIDFGGLLTGAIVAILVFIIGYSFTKYGKRKNLDRYGKLLKWAAPIILFTAIFVYINQIREILVAFASVAAVVIAVYSYDQSRQIRKDTLDRENRDRKERLLNEIINWVEEVGSKCAFESDPNEENASRTLEGALHCTEASKFISEHRRAFEYGYKQVSWKGDYVKTLAENIFTSKIGSVTSLVEALKEHLNLLHDSGVLKNSTNLPDIAKKIAEHNLSLNDLTFAVMKDAATIKTDLLDGD